MLNVTDITSWFLKCVYSTDIVRMKRLNIKKYHDMCNCMLLEVDNFIPILFMRPSDMGSAIDTWTYKHKPTMNISNISHTFITNNND